jgi:hypothetical protein
MFFHYEKPFKEKIYNKLKLFIYKDVNVLTYK